MPYGIFEAGMQWLCTIQDWLLREYRAERVVGVEPLFYKRGEDGRTNLLIAKFLDNFLISRTNPDVEKFLNNFNERFKLGKVGMSSKAQLFGMSFDQER